MCCWCPTQVQLCCDCSKNVFNCNQMQLQCVCGPNFGVYIICDHLQENQALCDVCKCLKRLIFDS